MKNLSKKSGFEVPVERVSAMKWVKEKLNIDLPIKESDDVDMEITFQYNKNGDDMVFVNFFDYTNGYTHKYDFYENSADNTIECYYSKRKHGYFRKYTKAIKIPV